MRNLLVALALVGMAAPAAANSKKGYVGATPWLQKGQLTSPSSLGPTNVATAYIRGLGHEGHLTRKAVRAASGSLVVFQQTHLGLPVRGAKAVVRVDGQGRVRWSADRLAALSSLSVVPALSAADALAKVAISSPESQELVVYAPGGRNPRLSYEVTKWESPTKRIRTWVDAHSGRVLFRANMVRHAAEHQANVFSRNPVQTPSTEVVTLSSVPSGADTLGAPGITVAQCEGSDGWDCYTTPIFADPDGSFLSLDYTSDTTYDDHFAGVQAFYHVSRAKEAASYLGLSDLYVDIEVNNATYYTCQGETDEPQPFNNAYFDGDSRLVFGQGSASDLAYDGDIVVHEFGHAIMGHLAPDMYGDYDAMGVNHVPQAVNEGFADYLAVTLSEDPQVGEYGLGSVAGLLPAGLAGVRNLELDKRSCNDMVGESHEDSLILTSALYSARQAYVATGGDVAEFDRGVLSSMHAFTGTEGFTDVANIVLAELETTLGAGPAATIEASLEATGLLNCDRVVELEPGVAHRAVMAGGWGDIPSPVQFSLDVDKATDKLTVSFDPYAKGSCGEVASGAVEVLYKVGGPIAWDWDGANSNFDSTYHDAQSAIGTFNGEGTVEVTIPGPIEKGTYHFQFRTEDVGLLTNIAVDGDGLEPGPDPGPDDEPTPGDTPDDDGAGCACNTNAGGSGPLAALLFLAFLGVLRRRPRAQAQTTR